MNIKEIEQVVKRVVSNHLNGLTVSEAKKRKEKTQFEKDTEVLTSRLQKIVDRIEEPETDDPVLHIDLDYDMGYADVEDIVAAGHAPEKIPVSGDVVGDMSGSYRAGWDDALEDIKEDAETMDKPYKVVKGDSLSKIAKKNNMSLAALKKINPQFRDDWDLISPGDIVYLDKEKEEEAPVEDEKPTESKHHKNENILVVGDSTAVNIASALPTRIKGSLKDGTYTGMPTMKVGHKSGQVLRILQKNIETTSKNLGHDKLKDKLMIISIGGNDSRWYELQNAHPRYKRLRKEGGPQTGNNETYHTPEFTYKNIMSMAKLGEQYGYEVRIVSMRPRKRGIVKDQRPKENYQEEHRLEVNSLLNGSGYKIISGDLGAGNLGKGNDYVHARKKGPGLLLKRAAVGRTEEEKDSSQKQINTESVSVPYGFVKRKLGFSQGMWDIYRDTLGKSESGNNYSSIGGGHDLFDGRWQLGGMAKKDAARILRKPISTKKALSKEFREEFRNNPQMQEDFFAAYTKANNGYMSKSSIYRNSSIQEKMKILAHAHLVGHGPTKEWLRAGKKGVHKDAFGTKASSYYMLIDKALRQRDNV